MKKEKKYIKPDIEIVKFSIDDIITKSLGTLDEEEPIEQPTNP